MNDMPMRIELTRRSLLLGGAATLGIGVLLPAPLRAENPVPFRDWLSSLREEVVREGISSATFDSAFARVQPIERVLELDRKQPERTLTFQEYMDKVVTQVRIENARQRYSQHSGLLRGVSDKFGVQSRFIVALWAIESDFGRIMGNFSVIAALATLAYDGRRSAFFKKELFDALRILQDERLPVDRFTGSWAGAMGQSQFMPSSFRRFAVDFDGDGRRDIWSSLPDVFASAANYLSQSGWRADQTWGREVRLPEKYDVTQNGLEIEKPLEEWRRIGFRRRDGAELPVRDMRAALVLPGGEQGPAFLVYNNYRVILKWNRSLYFATAVGSLADRIEAV
jgi:membrane-bound lytic murein transglycosylase B